MFYTYMWLREDGTPYYVGKGHGKRVYERHRRHGAAPSEERIVVYIAKDEQESFDIETILIWYYGRKDIGTGCLRNLTNGGEGPAGCKPTIETRNKMRASHPKKWPTGRCSNNGWVGRAMTQEHKDKIRKARTGSPWSVAKRAAFTRFKRAVPVCHPDAKYKGKGMCTQCYMKQYRKST